MGASANPQMTAMPGAGGFNQVGTATPNGMQFGSPTGKFQDASAGANPAAISAAYTNPAGLGPNVNNFGQVGVTGYPSTAGQPAGLTGYPSSPPQAMIEAGASPFQQPTGSIQDMQPTGLIQDNTFASPSQQPDALPPAGQPLAASQQSLNPTQQQITQAAQSANPYQQAAGAQAAALGRVGQGMNQTAVPGMQAYANPYENQVVQASLRDVGNAAQTGLNQLDYQAGQAGAFGGSRHGIAQAETMQGFNQQALDQTARLRAQGFNTALGASQADIGRQLGAAGQMAGLGGQSFGYGQAIQGQQAQQGAQQQQMMQSLIDAAKGQYAGYTGAPQQGLNTMLGTMTGVPGQTAGQTSSMTPGLFNYLQAAASF